MCETNLPTIDIELAFVAHDAQVLTRLSLDVGATVADAIKAADLQTSFPDYCFVEMATGVWGQRVTQQHSLRNGDRVEIYRELERDPMEARRLRALDSTPGPSGSR